MPRPAVRPGGTRPHRRRAPFRRRLPLDWRALAGIGRRRSTAAARLAALPPRWAVPLGLLAPPACAGLALLAGAVLLLAGATAAEPAPLAAFSPALVELAHFAASLLGAALLMVAHGLRRRLAGAWVLGVAALVAGTTLGLVKGLGWAGVAALLAALAVLLACRPAFHRRSRLLDDRLSAGWWALIAGILLTALAATLFAFPHLREGHHFWWQLALDAEALRATLAAALAVGAVALHRLLRAAPAAPAAPDAGDLADAASVLAAGGRGAGRLALTGDKALLFNADRTAFLMYRPAGGSWVALGEPVGPVAAWPELAWAFHEAAERHGARTIFYQLGPHHLPLVLDLGLRLVKLGEAARVDLRAFSLTGRKRQDLRTARSRLGKEGAAFELVPAAAVPPLLPELRRVSDAWLASRRTREKRFSVGYFLPAYLAACPVAAVRGRDGRVLAFANLLPAADRSDCAVDLMRVADEAPPGTMDFLLVEAMLWAQREGYAWFDLGTAPLAGLPEHWLAPSWSKLGRLLVDHGSRFYNFRGLRGFKQKFDPAWEPAYLAYPGGSLPRVLAETAALVAGGWSGIVRK